MEEDIKILTEEEIMEKLKGIPGWAYKYNRLSKSFKFNNFMDGIALIIKLAPICERVDHHPDIHIFYKKIVFELQRYSVGGRVTDRDFFIASEIERLYNEYREPKESI